MARSRRSPLSVSLLALLLCTPAMAASSRAVQIKEPAGVFSSFWGLLESLAPSSTTRSHRKGASPAFGGFAQSAAGCDLGSVMDPNGCPGHSHATGGSPDLGSVMDPNG
jgi:hypothetical protein